MISFAKAICDHVPDERDASGRSQRPCQWCVKAVRIITQCWFVVLMTKYKVVNERRSEVPAIGLDDGYFLSAGLLDPEVAITIDGWGPA